MAMPAAQSLSFLWIKLLWNKIVLAQITYSYWKIGQSKMQTLRNENVAFFKPPLL